MKPRITFRRDRMHHKDGLRFYDVFVGDYWYGTVQRKRTRTRWRWFGYTDKMDTQVWRRTRAQAGAALVAAVSA